MKTQKNYKKTQTQKNNTMQELNRINFYQIMFIFYDEMTEIAILIFWL